MTVNKLIDGLVRYIDENIYSAMNDWQKMIAADVVSRAMQRSDKIAPIITENTFVRALGYVDSEGNVDVDGILCKIKEYITQKGKLEIKIPFMPTYKMYAEDIDVLRRTIGG
jgi:hypothetical protein